MKVEELRIGNYISYREEWYCEVESLGHNFATINKDLTGRLYQLQCGSSDIEDYKPITLDEGWLAKFGFSNRNKELSNCDLWDKHWKGGFEITKESEKEFNYNGIVNIKYVHQLQNLCFALTCEELVIKDGI